ncbi:MAG: ZIP family metal transporter [Eubacteriales bacterium]
MEIVLLTALGVGGATLLGALIVFVVKSFSHKFEDIVLSFAAGVMLSAAVMGLILPSIEYGGGAKGLPVTIIGIFAGALVINLLDKLVPHLHKLSGIEPEKHPERSAKIDKVFLFVLAIAIHNFPEGIAAGVGFGTENVTDGLTIAAAIALQNIPEGMVVIGPMISAGLSKKRALLIAAATGAVEVLGTIVGYFAVSVSQAMLPFGLAFAGGTMLYVVSDEMIPETHSHGNERGATYALLVGFCVMLVMDLLLG